MKKYFSSYWIRAGFYTFLQRFSVIFFGVINLMIIIRKLSTPEKMGIWALFLVVTTIFETTKTALLKNAHIRYITGNSSDEKSAIASSSLLLNSLLSVLFILFLVFFSDNLGNWLHAGKELSEMLIWFIPGLIVMVFFSHLEAVQQSHLDFKGVFAGYFSRQLVFFLIIAGHYILNKGFSLIDLVIYQSISIVAGTIVQYIYSRKFLLHRFNPSIAWIKNLVSYGGYIFGSGVVASVFANLDQIMTATFLKTPSSVAYYNLATRVNGMVDMPTYVAADIIFPKSSKASVEEGPGKVKYLFEKMVAALLLITIPVSIFIISFPGLIIRIIGGPGYLAASLILQLYVIAGIFRPFQHQSANLLNSIGKPGLCFLMNGITLAANLVINYICFRNFGFYGPAIGTLITILLSTTVWYFVMRKQVGVEIKNIARYMGDYIKQVKARIKR